MRPSRNATVRIDALGLAVGIFIGAFLLALLIVARAAQLAAGPATMPTTPTPVPTNTSPHLDATPIVGTPTLALAPARPAQTQIEKGEALLEDGEATAALEVLIPLLDQLQSAEELSRLNADLGRAEAILGHFQRAAGYLEAAFALGPKPELLLDVASCYDIGGDLHTALARYLRLAAWTDAPEELRQVARERARAIVDVIGTPTPGP